VLEYRSDQQIQSVPRFSSKASMLRVTASSRLVSLEVAVETLAAEKGWELSVKTAREYCRSGKWVCGYQWVKPGKQYLINLESVYAWLAQ
jgi:hypothetical protein